MSYDIDLLDPVTRKVIVLDAPHHMRGGTYVVGGTSQASFNITYNYSEIYHKIFPGSKDNKDFQGIRSIYGLTGAESIPVLESAINKLANDTDADYWKPTEGNAKKALMCLLALARMRPDGVWDGD